MHQVISCSACLWRPLSGQDPPINMVSQDLVLDRDVRDWVLIPLTVSVILMKLLQQYAVKVGLPVIIGYGSNATRTYTVRPGLRVTFPLALQLMAAPKPSEPPKPEDMQQKNALARSSLLRANHGFISEAGFRQRRAYFSGKVSACVAGSRGRPKRALLPAACRLLHVGRRSASRLHTSHRRASCCKLSQPRA